jgi:hypothetical protein
MIYKVNEDCRASLAMTPFDLLFIIDYRLLGLICF